MTAFIGLIVFGGSAVVAAYAIVQPLVLNWRRVCELASGKVERPFAPLRTLAVAERRIAIRRWALPRRLAVETRAAA